VNRYNKIYFIFLILFIFSCKDKNKDYTSITGSWRCEELGSLNSKVYTVDIEKSSSDETQYAIYNFYNKGYEEKIYMKLENDTFRIETQFIGATTVSVEGFGVSSSDFTTMTFQYTIYDDISTVDINANFTHL